MRFGLEWRTDYGVRITCAGLIGRRIHTLWDASRTPFGYSLSLVATAPHESHYGTTRAKSGLWKMARPNPTGPV
jgi:hypothetical protein